MLTRAKVFGFVATILLTSVSFGSETQGNQTPEGVARQQMLGTRAPDLNVTAWLNTKQKALSLMGLKGKVVVLDFFTYH